MSVLGRLILDRFSAREVQKRGQEPARELGRAGAELMAAKLDSLNFRYDETRIEAGEDFEEQRSSRAQT